MTQVFATKVRILDQLERLKPGMEGLTACPLAISPMRYAPSS